MNEDALFKGLFHVEIRQGVYLISEEKPAGNRSLAPGSPTGNSYLIIGEKDAVLFDLAVDHQALFDYAQYLCRKPVRIVLSHGHFDHIFHLDKVAQVWMHPADVPLLEKSMVLHADGTVSIESVNPFPHIHPLLDGYTMDLGNRVLDVFHVPGHTMGSILLLDRRTRTLFSGDSCGRRLLYAPDGYVPTEHYCASLEMLLDKEFDAIYSAHDRCALPKENIVKTIKLIDRELPGSEEIWDCPGVGPMKRLVHSNMYCLDFFDMTIPVDYDKKGNDQNA